jgi:HD superfamily phosphohydrolase
MVTHLDATHTRLSHAIGTANVASLLLARVKASTRVKAVRELDIVWERACLFYCFIHDAFHGPMGHSLDIMRSALGISLEEKVDDEQFRTSLRSALDGGSDPIGKQLWMAASRALPGREDALLQAVDTLADPAALLYQKPEAFYLRDIVTSAIDADRLDYLVRDAELLDGTDLRQPFRYLVKSATAVPEGDLVRLAFGIDEKPHIERALGMRRKLYSQHYEAAPKLILDDMLCHGIYYVLSELGLTGDATQPIPERDRTEAIRQLLLLTDGDLLPALGELRASPAAYDLLIRFLQRRYFVEFYRVPMRYSDTDRVVGEFNGWMEQISGLIEELAVQRRRKNYPMAADRAHDLPRLHAVTEEYLGTVINAEQVLVFGLQKLLEGSFEDRVAFERDVWARFCRLYDTSEDIRHAYLHAETGSTSGEKLVELQRRPPLHVTTSSFFDISSRDDVMRYLKEGGQADKEGVLLYKRLPSGEYESSREFIRTEIVEDEPVLPLLLSAPAKLIDLAGEGLREAALGELRECAWLWQLLAKGRQLPASDR